MKFLIILDDGNKHIVEADNILDVVEESCNPHYGYDHIISVTNIGE